MAETVLARVRANGAIEARVAGSAERILTESGLTRGDGVFESIAVHDGRPRAFDTHLARLAASCAQAEIKAPPTDLVRALVDAAIAGCTARPRISVRIIVARGPADRAEVFVTATETPDFASLREKGVSVALLSRGYRSDVGEGAPWLMQGAKSLSYAVNAAAVREARRRGADDAVFLSTDDVVLEGATSAVVIREGDRFVAPPADRLPILASTAQAEIFAALAERGIETALEAFESARLREASDVWLVSSIRQVVPVREIDGNSRGFDARLTRVLNAATAGDERPLAAWKD